MSNRGTFVIRNGELVPKDVALAMDARRRVSRRSDFPMPQIRRDSMSPIKSSFDGRVYDSKSAWERHVKANGREIVGNDDNYAKPKYTETPQYSRDIKADIAKAFEMHEQGYQAPPVTDAREWGIDLVSDMSADGYVRGPSIDDNKIVETVESEPDDPAGCSK